MEKKRRNMLLYVTATSVVGLACNDTPRAVGDVAPSPDFRVGKVAMIVRDAAPEPISDDASPGIPLPTVTDAGADLGSTKSADAAAWPRAQTPRQVIHPPGKIAAPPDK